MQRNPHWLWNPGQTSSNLKKKLKNRQQSTQMNRSTLALKPRANRTRKSRHGYQWPRHKGFMSSIFLKLRFAYSAKLPHHDKRFNFRVKSSTYNVTTSKLQITTVSLFYGFPTLLTGTPRTSCICKDAPLCSNCSSCSNKDGSDRCGEPLGKHSLSINKCTFIYHGCTFVKVRKSLQWIEFVHGGGRAGILT